MATKKKLVKAPRRRVGTLRKELDALRIELGSDAFRTRQKNMRISVLTAAEVALIADMRRVPEAEIFRDGWEIGKEIYIGKDEGLRVALIDSEDRIVKEIALRAGR